MNTLSLSFMCLAIWVIGTESTYEYRWCCKSAREATKCQKLADLRNDDKTKPFNFNCVQFYGTDTCVKEIQNGKADLMILDAGDIATYADDLRMVAVENVNKDNTDVSGTGYYALAVVKKGSTFTLKTAVEYNTCHTGVGKTAGWNMPMGWFKLNNVTASRIPKSCAPGANQDKYYDSLPKQAGRTKADLQKKWCELCIGDDGGDHECDRNQRERYYGYNGAFGCLKTVGDVAFIKETTIPEDERSDYRLLCPDGTTKSVAEYKDCNIAHVPPHALVASKTTSNDILKEIFNRLNSAWGATKVQPLKFSGGKDLLWGSSVHNFIEIGPSTKVFLKGGHDYFCNLEALEGKTKSTGCLSAAEKPK